MWWLVGWVVGWLVVVVCRCFLRSASFFLLLIFFFFFVSPRILSSSFFLAGEYGGFLRFSLHEDCAFSIAFWLFAFLFVRFCIARRSISSFLRCLPLLFISNRVLCIFIFFLILLRFSLWNVAVVVGWLMGQLATASLFSLLFSSFCLQERSLFSLDYSVSRSRTVVFWFFVSLCAPVLSLLFNRLASSFSL